jgi:hypothetical protein
MTDLVEGTARAIHFLIICVFLISSLPATMSTSTPVSFLIIPTLFNVLSGYRAGGHPVGLCKERDL